MASPSNVELEAAKFLHKLIQDSKDEPAKLATKLFVILQHMKSSGKEHSMPYQVISRAMETVISQNGLDIEALKSSRLPLTSGTQIGDSSTTQCAGSSSQGVGAAKDSKAGFVENETSKMEPFTSSRPPVGPSGTGHDYYQVSGTHRSSQSFDHESPSSLDTKSANSQSQERQKDGKKSSAKRKRGDSSISHESQNENPQQLDSSNPVVHPRKGKMNKVEPPGVFSVKGGEHSNFNVVPSGGQMEHFSSLSGNMSSILRVKQEGQNATEKPMVSANISNSMSRAPNSKFPEDVEVSSSVPQQGSSLSSTNDVLGARALWNQNRAGFPFERSQVPRFTGNVMTDSLMQQPAVSSLAANAFRKVHGGMSVGPSSYPTGESGSSTPAPVESQLLSTNCGDETSTILSSGKALEHDGSLNTLGDANRVVQVGRQNSISGTTMLRTTPSRDTGRLSVSQAPALSGMPFKEQQLKQLRAQCLVFLAFRNGLVPKKLHLEIALGNIFPREGGNIDGSHRELIDNHTGKAQSLNDPSSISGVVAPYGRPGNTGEADRILLGASSSGRFLDADSSSKEAENLKMEYKSGPPADHSVLAEESKQQATGKLEAEMQSHETAEPQVLLTSAAQQPESVNTRSGLAITNPVNDMENGHLMVGRANVASSLMGINKPMNNEINSWTGINSQNEVSRRPLPASTVPHELVKDNAPNHFPNVGNSGASGNQHATRHLSSFTVREQWKPLPGTDNDHRAAFPAKDASGMLKHMSQDDPKFSDGSRPLPVDNLLRNGISFTTEQDEEDNSLHPDAAPSPKYTMSEKWIMDMQKRKLLVEQNWIMKQQKAKQRISACFDKLKENMSSSEDISAKTKRVIELKKLQLLGLQRRLRSDFLNDFFKPITTDMDRLKSYKKHRHGRRIKQLEKFEQKMKEERQKRIRERQKEFFSEIEVHKERLDEVFKIKRERWRGVTKYVKEFHKRKERIHREKIDRIQREKINLLKINDVEGYLRMVQDAKSDRVKQLLKETEKYLQKLGSKLQEAKAMASRFEQNMDETETPSAIESYEPAAENEDESDQAKHYLESNEKYYLMAHSIKENISEQPTCLHGGKLREYQMNGLRWLVSLYNNHLNGILADEMGLGKTVQVIALICYLMETKNDRGPFLVVVPSSVLPGWESEINFWAPGIHKIVYSGPPEDRRRLFKEQIVHQKFNVLLTTYEYLMNKHDRPKLSKIQWHYVIIDEGHRIKNASCKLNADLKHYQSFHRLLLTGTPLQNNLEELWALLNFLLPNLFNSSEDFSQWFNKPFESNGDNSPDEALLSEEENLLIINRLHQVLRPFVLRRLKHKVENKLPEKIERFVRCEASAYQKLLMKRVEENLGAIGNSKARSVHNSVMELRNICNHPYLSHLHAEEVDTLIPKHYLPPIVRICGKLEMLDRLLPKLKATDHRVLFFSTMTRLLDVMEDYLTFKQYRYLRLDGHTSGGDRGALIEKFNHPGSPFFIFLLSIRAGGVGVNLQAADTVILFDTDWNPQVDLQAQARAHRIGQKRDVLVLRFETVQTVEEQVRASAEHKLGVANQSITAGFFDNNTSAEDRREYLESLLRESKKEEAAPVLDDDALNDLIARSESEIDVFESVDNQRREKEMATWKKLVWGQGRDTSEPLPPLPSRLVTDDDLKAFYEAMKIYDVPKAGVSPNVGVKRKGEYLGALDTQQYGRGKRAREVRSYEEQLTEEQFEKLCQVDHPESPKLNEEGTENLPTVVGSSTPAVDSTEAPGLHPSPAPPSLVPPQLLQSKEVTPPSKRGRGRPRRADKSPVAVALPAPSGTGKLNTGLQRETVTSHSTTSGSDSLPGCTSISGATACVQDSTVGVAPSSQPTSPLVSVTPGSQSAPVCSSIPMQPKGRGQKIQGGELVPQHRGKKLGSVLPVASDGLPSPGFGPGPKINEQPQSESINPSGGQATAAGGTASSIPIAPVPDSVPSFAVTDLNATIQPSAAGAALNSETTTQLASVPPVPQLSPNCPSVPLQTKGQSGKTQSGVVAPRRRGKRQASISTSLSDGSAGLAVNFILQQENNSGDLLGSKSVSVESKQDAVSQELSNVIQVQPCGVNAPTGVAAPDQRSLKQSDCIVQCQQPTSLSAAHDSASCPYGPASGQVQSVDLHDDASGVKEVLSENTSLKGGGVPALASLDKTAVEEIKTRSSKDKACTNAATVGAALPAVDPLTEPYTGSTTVEGTSKTLHHVSGTVALRTRSVSTCPSVPAGSHSTPPQASASLPVKRQGRKTPTTGEAPRRRGKKQGPGIPSFPDGSAGLDAKFNQQSQNKSRESVGSKIVSLKSKQETADVNDVARVMKEIFSETCSLKAKTSESSSNEGRDASSRAVTSNAVAEVAKNQSSDDGKHIVTPTAETAPPGFDIPNEKHKEQLDTEKDAGVKSENTLVSGVVLTSEIEAFKREHMAVENLADSSLDDRAHPVAPTSEAAPPGFDNATKKNKEQSGTESDVNGEDTLFGEALASKTQVSKQENKIDAISVENMADSVSDEKTSAVTPTFGKPLPQLDIAIEKTESDTKGKGDHTPLSGKAYASETETLKSENKIDGGSVENLADSRQLSNETSTIGSTSEYIYTIPPIASEKEDVVSQSLCAPDSDLTEFNKEARGGQEMGSLNEFNGRTENNYGNNTLIASKGPPNSPVVGASCVPRPTICITADNASDPHRANSSESSMMEPPATIENRSGNISEPSSKESLQCSPLAVSNLEAASVPTKVVPVGDHSQATALSVGSTDHSGMVNSPAMIGVAANTSEFSSKVPLELAECSFENILESRQILGKAINPGIPLELSEIASSCNTASLDDSPDKHNMEALSGGSGDKADCTVEPVCLVASGSMNLEVVPTELGAEKADGDIEVCNMEVDPSNTLASFPKDIVAESAKVDIIPDDHGKTLLLPGVENTEGGEIVLQYMSDNQGEMVDVSSSEKGAVGSMLTLQDSRATEAEIGDRIDVSQVDGSSPRSVTGNLAPSSSSFTTEKESVEAGQVGSSESLRDFKGSEAEVGGQVDVSPGSGVNVEKLSENSEIHSSLLATVGQKREGLSGEDVVCNMEVDPSNTRASSPKDIVAESVKVDIIPDDHGKMQKHLGVENTEGGEIVLQHVSENKGEKVDVASEKGGVGSMLALQDFKASGAGISDRIDVSHVDESSPRSICGNLALPSSSFTTEKENVEAGPFRSSESSRDFKGSEAEVGGQVDVSPGSGMEKLSEGSELATVEDKREGLSREDVVCNMEVDPSNTRASSPKDIVAESAEVDIIPDDHGKTQWPPGVENTEGGEILPQHMKVEKVDVSSEKGAVGSIVTLQDFKASEAEIGDGIDVSQVDASSPRSISGNLALPSSSFKTEKENVEAGTVGSSKSLRDFKGSETEVGGQAYVSPGTGVIIEKLSEGSEIRSSLSATVEEKQEGLSGEDVVCNIEVDPSNTQASSPKDIVAESAKVDIIPDDNAKTQLPLGVENTDGGEIVLQHMSENKGEKVDFSSEKSAVGSLLALQDFKASEAEIGDRIDVAHVDGSPPRSISGNLAIPSSSFTAEKENVEAGPVGSSESPRDVKASKVEVGGQIDASPGSGVKIDKLSESLEIHSSLLATVEEEQEGLSGEDIVFCSVAEDGHQVGVSQGGEVVPGKLSENLGLPPSDLVTEEEKIVSYPDQDYVSSLVVLQNSYGSIDEASEEMDNSPRGAVVLENLSDLGLPSAFLVTEEAKIEPSVENGPLSSSLVGLQVSKESLAKASDQVGVSQGGVVVPRKSSEELPLGLSSMENEEEKIQGSLDKDLVTCMVVLEDSKGSIGEAGDQMNNSQNAAVVPEDLSNLGLLASSLDAEEAKMEASSEKDCVSRLAAMEDSKTSAAEAGDKMGVSWSDDVVPGSASVSLGGRVKKD